MEDEDRPYTFRLPTELVARLDAFAEHLSRQTPGLGNVTRTAAVRVLLTQALGAVEREYLVPNTPGATISGRKPRR